MITGISGWVLLSKNGRFVMVNCFSKICLLKPLFYSVLGLCAFWAKVVKRGNSGPPKIKTENLTDN